MLTKITVKKRRKKNHKRKQNTKKQNKNYYITDLLLGFALVCCVGLRTIPKNPSRPTNTIVPMLVD